MRVEATVCFPRFPYLYGIRSQQGTQGMGQQFLHVDHSNVLKPGIALQSTQPRWFYLLVM